MTAVSGRSRLGVSGAILSVLVFALAVVGVLSTPATGDGRHLSTTRISTTHIAVPLSRPAPSPDPADRHRSASRPSAPAPSPQARPVRSESTPVSSSGRPSEAPVPATGPGPVDVDAVQAGLAHQLTTGVVTGRDNDRAAVSAESAASIAASAAVVRAAADAARTTAVRTRAAQAEADVKVAVAARERRNHSMIYSGTMALLIAGVGLLMLGSRRRRW